MLKNTKFLMRLKIRATKPSLYIILIIIFLMTLSGCSFLSKNEDKRFMEEYSMAQEKYAKYLNEPVTGQEVLDLIDNWDESEFDMTVEDSEGYRFSVNDIDKDDTIFNYWDEESTYYIDPDAFYEASFILYQSPKKEDRKIVELCFARVEKQ